MASNVTIKLTPTAEVQRRMKEKALNKIKKLQQSVTQQIPSKVGRPLIDQIIDTVQRGYSPVAGQGRFPAYKNPKKYPGNRKPPTPVNLTLSGRFLNDLDATQPSFSEASQRHKIKIGFTSDYGKTLEKGHTDPETGQPHRQVIPNKGESFNAKLLKFAKDLYNRLLKDKL